MVPSINQIIVNQSVVFGCDWIDWKPPNILELTLSGFQDSSHGGFTLFTPLPDTVPWDGPSEYHRKWGLHSDSDPRCPRCWHSLCFPLFFSMFWSILHVFLVTRKTIGIHWGHCSSGRKAIRGPIPWHSQCRRGRRSWQQKLPMLKQPHRMVPVICDFIPYILHGECRGRFTISGGMGWDEWCFVADHASLGVPEFGPLYSRCWENAYKYLRSWSITQTCLDSHELFRTRMNNPNDVFWGTYWNHPTASVMVSWCHLDVHPASPEIGVPPNHPF